MYQQRPCNLPVIHQRVAVAIDTRGPLHFTGNFIHLILIYIYCKYELQCAPQHVNKMKYVNMHFRARTRPNWTGKFN